MNAEKLPRRRLLLPLAAVALLAAGVVAYFLWWRTPRLPQPGEPLYEDYVVAFQVGTAQLDSGLSKEGEASLSKAIDLVPAEPAGWANRGLLYLRLQRLKEAEADIARARQMAPDNVEILEMAAHLAERQDRLSDALALFRQASEADPNDPRRLYKVSEVLAKEAKPGADAARVKVLEQLLKLKPANLGILTEQARLAAAAGDRDAARRALDRLGELAPRWSGQEAMSARELLGTLRKDVEKDLGRVFQQRIGSLQNLLKVEPGYARGMEEVRPIDAQAGNSLQQFLKLAPVRTSPDEPDAGLTFAAAERPWTAEARAGGWALALPVWLNGKDNPVVFAASAKEVRRADGAGAALPFPSGTGAVPPGPDGVVAVDYLGDAGLDHLLTDFLLAGAGGLRFHRQKPDGTFVDVTAATKLPADVLSGDYAGAWAVDIDLDGDLDFVAARRQGGPLLLRNNYDGTFTAQEIFPGVTAARGFAWLDLDNDGAADAALLDDMGRLHVFMNQRSGQFTRREPPDAMRRYQALAVADVNDDGVLDLIVLGADGKPARISDRDKGQAWDVAELGAASKVRVGAPGSLRLVAADVDNNGAIDLVLRTPGGSAVWLADGKGGFAALAGELPAGVADVADLDGTGALSLVGTDATGRPTVHTARGTKGYQWLRVRAHAATKAGGDQRINPYGIGGEVELRAGVLVVKQPLDKPAVHFGLGSRKRADLLRFNWTNGALQYEFDVKPDHTYVVTQRLKGSCPFLYTWDGEKVVFVTDFCWSTPLGMRINGQANAAFVQTTDWVKVRGELLRPRGGVYDVRVHANLWETLYLDQLGLRVIDHPPGTEVYADERFFLTPTKLQVYLTGPSSPVYRATDHKGADVTEVVRAADGRYLDTCGRGTYQGVTRDHWVEVDLGDDAPKSGPVYLLATGWIHPTDSSINFAMEQGKHPRPMPLVLEVPDGTGGWRAAGPPLGFPAGKNKTCVIRLDGVAGDGVARRVRLRTNMEIFWDALRYAKGLDASVCKQQVLPIRTAELRYRGMVHMSQASPSAPELPHYDEVVRIGQTWRDLIGHHTRFGDVKELLEGVDDRYVIMNAGDEIALTFAAPAGPAAGMIRDYVWASDGWSKDGDLNTRWGKTVLPLPYHGMTSYDAPPGALRDDPVYRRFPKDWEVYHTRYVTPSVHERGLRGFRRPR